MDSKTLNNLQNEAQSEDTFEINVNLKTLFNACLVVLATLFSHWQSISGGFIWDDDAHVTRQFLRSLNGLWQIWFKLGATQQYYPIVHSTFWIEQALWGDNAALYHLTNIVFHIIVVFMLVAVLKQLAIPGAWIAGFIFALHPVHVESVAWITEQKNTISAIFYLITALFYLKFDSNRQIKYYTYASILFIIALLSKSVTATLPPALLVLFWWRRGKISFKNDVIPLIPFFIIGICGGIFTAWIEKVYIGAQGSDYQSAVQLTPLTRCLLAGHVILFYLSKLLWPTNLTFIYEHWSISASDYTDYIYTFSVIIILALLVRYAITGGNRKSYDTFSRAPLAGFLFFAGTLFPVLGFANVYPFMFSYVADHFQYLASVGIIVPLCAYITIRLEKLSDDFYSIIHVLGGCIIALFGFLSFLQCNIYKNGETLYRDTILKNPSCWMAHNNLGAILLSQGKQEEAKIQFSTALKIRPDYPDARSNMCSVLIREGNLKEALVNAQEAKRLRPSSPENLNNLGIVLFNLGRNDESIAIYNEAIRLRPEYPEVLNNLGNALVQSGKKQEDLDCYIKAIKFKNDFPEAYANISILYLGSGHIVEGINCYEQAVKLLPASSNYHKALGLAYSNAGRINDSILQLQESLKLNQLDWEAWYFLANTLVAGNKYTEAEMPYLNSIKLKPDNVGAENNLASIYYKSGNYTDSILHYKLAIRLNPNYAEAHNNLGVVYVASKLINEGILEYKKAIQLNPKYADSYNNWGLALTQMGEPRSAIDVIKKAIEINFNNPDYHDNLAAAYNKIGDKKKVDEQNAIATKIRNPK